MKWGLGRSLAMVALVVQAPRLILSILDADQIPISPSTRQSLLIVAAIGTASILTGGQLYLIHVIGTCSKWRSGLVIIWLGVLTFSGAMIIPAVFGGLSSTLLPSVLSLEQKLWWSLIAAMSHELTAAGCVLASIAHDQDGGVSGDGDELLLKVTMERNELEDRVRELESQEKPVYTVIKELEHTPAEDLWRTERPLESFTCEYVSSVPSSPYPFPCPYCHLSINSPEDVFNHSNCQKGA